MLTYHEYEKTVFDWLMAKHQQDPNFTFTVRQSAGKGSETDYFIGTSKSNYFATTFWTLPVSFPGSSGDCISLILQLSKVGYGYYFEFNQTQDPDDKQNQSALNLVKALKEPLQKILNFKRPVQEANKMYTIQVASPEKIYGNLDLMFFDIDKQLAKIIEITDAEIEKEKSKNPEFKAYRVNKNEFDDLINRLNKRIEKHNNTLNSVLNQYDEEIIDRYFDTLKRLLKDLGVDATSDKIYFNYEKDKLIFGIGQRYVFIIEQGKYFRMISNKKGTSGTEEFKNEPKAYLNNYALNIDIEPHYNELLLAAKDILEITKKSGHYKFDKKDFRALVFEHMSLSSTEVKEKQMQHSLNQILYGPPGTGKTYNTINRALSIIENRPDDDLALETREALKDRYQAYVANGQIVFTTFHQSMSYEDFVEGIKPQTVNEKVVYEVEPGIFKLISDKARGAKGNFEQILEQFKTEVNQGVREKALTIKSKSTDFDIEYRGTNVFYVQPHNSSKENPWYPVNIENIRKVFDTGNYERIYNSTYVREIISYWEKEYQLKKRNGSSDEPFVLIIDEINRGNVSAIFGELITLIEDSKRAGASEALELTLPYSKENFSVPSNLYIIGTMNTADRSVEALDTALRRRFAFEEMMPEPAKITTDGALAASAGVLEGVDLAQVLTKINERIAILLDVDHQIGHSYLINVSDTHGLANAFNNCILPLLKEYFYHDDEKIALVLGSGFVQVKAQTNNIQALFPMMQGLEVYSIDSKQQFELKPVKPDTIITALQTLLNGD